MANDVDREMRALSLARGCAALGARVRTSRHVSGLLPRTVLRVPFPDPGVVPRGRCPNSREWSYSANLLYRAEASIVMARFRRLRTVGFVGADALLGAYRQYLGVCQPPARIRPAAQLQTGNQRVSQTPRERPAIAMPPTTEVPTVSGERAGATSP
jgi:flagellar transcriptional activator FlhC